MTISKYESNIRAGYYESEISKKLKGNNLYIILYQVI